MIDHTSFDVKNFVESQKFYDETFATLGYTRLMNFESEEGVVAGYGQNAKPSFWIGSRKDYKGHEEIGKALGFHVAFLAPHKDAVDTWYAKCIELGGICNGKPGPRPEYHPGYYGAFIIDPNGWRIEAAIHTYSKD